MQGEACSGVTHIYKGVGKTKQEHATWFVRLYYAPCSSLNKRRRQTHTEEKTSAISPRGEVYGRCPVFAAACRLSAK